MWTNAISTIFNSFLFFFYAYSMFLLLPLLSLLFFAIYFYGLKQSVKGLQADKKKKVPFDSRDVITEVRNPNWESLQLQFMFGPLSNWQLPYFRHFFTPLSSCLWIFRLIIWSLSKSKIHSFYGFHNFSSRLLLHFPAKCFFFLQLAIKTRYFLSINLSENKRKVFKWFEREDKVIIVRIIWLMK